MTPSPNDVSTRHSSHMGELWGVDHNDIPPFKSNYHVYLKNTLTRQPYTFAFVVWGLKNEPTEFPAGHFWTKHIHIIRLTNGVNKRDYKVIPLWEQSLTDDQYKSVLVPLGVKDKKQFFA